MASPFVLDGDSVDFEPAFGPAQVVVRPGTIRASRSHFTVLGRAVCVLGDETFVEVPDCLYTTPACPVPGRGKLTIEAIAPDQESRRALVGDQHALVKGQRMPARFTVAEPAKQPPPSSAPDPLPRYAGFATFRTDQSRATAGTEAVAASATDGNNAPGPAPAAAARSPASESQPEEAQTVEWKLRLQDRFGPIANEPFVLTLTGVPERIVGRSNTDGDVIARIPKTVRRGRLDVGEGTTAVTLRLAWGELSDIDTAEGQIQRLRHLGYLPSTSAGHLLESPAVRRAVADFQLAQDLPASGEMTDQTRRLLRDLHRC